MPLSYILESLKSEPDRTLLKLLQHGPLDYDAAKQLASGGTADAVLKRLLMLGGVRRARDRRDSTYELTRLGFDMLESIDIAEGLPGGIRIFDILYRSAGLYVLLHHLGYLVRDLGDFPSSTRNGVTRRLRDAGVINEDTPPQVVDEYGHRFLLAHLHDTAYRHYDDLADRARQGARGVELSPYREDVRREHPVPRADGGADQGVE
jgi:predicted transcriptional regulator